MFGIINLKSEAHLRKRERKKERKKRKEKKRRKNIPDELGKSNQDLVSSKKR